MAVEIPPALAKHGIVAVTDNLGPGEVLNIGPLFNRIFRSEIEARIFKQGKPGCDAAAADVNVPSRSK